MERSGDASNSEAGSTVGAAVGVVGPEPTTLAKGAEGAEKAAALHEQLGSLVKQLQEARGEARGKVELQVEMELVSKETKKTEAKCAAIELKLQETTEKSAIFKEQLDEANKKLSLMAKSGDERVLGLEKELNENETLLKTVRSKAEKQAWDLEEAQTALRSMHSAVCRQAPPAPVGGIGVALATETVSVKGKQQKMVKVTQIASSGPAAASGVKPGDLLVEVDGRDVTNFDVKQIKEMTKGPPGSPMPNEAQGQMQRGGGTWYRYGHLDGIRVY